jgi:hypothetical protein
MTDEQRTRLEALAAIVGMENGEALRAALASLDDARRERDAARAEVAALRGEYQRPASASPEPATRDATP